MKHSDLLAHFREAAPADRCNVGDILTFAANPEEQVNPKEYYQVTEVTAEGWKMKPLNARHALMELAGQERLKDRCAATVADAQRIKAITRAFNFRLDVWPDQLFGWAEPVFAWINN